MMSAVKKSVVVEMHGESSDAHLKTIIGTWPWTEALEKWYRSDGCPADITLPQFGLSKESWRDLQVHLRGTGWFISNEKTIFPTVEGQEFLIRIDELYRAINRQDLEDQTVGLLLKQVPLGGAVDIGCGPGHSVMRLAQLGFTPLYAYDVSSIAIATARAVLENAGDTAEIYAREATSLKEIASTSLSLVFSRGALHYFKQKELAETLSRTLRPGGYLIAEIVGIRYYLQRKHLKRLFSAKWRGSASYARTILRTMLYEASNLQLKFGARAAEIGYTRRSIHQLAKWGGLKVVSVGPAPSSVGYLVMMRKPEDAA